MCIMKWFAVVIVTVLCVRGAVGYCPSLCTCKSNKSNEGSGMEPLPGELVRLKCGGAPSQLTELKEIDLSKVWNSVVSL